MKRIAKIIFLSLFLIGCSNVSNRNSFLDPVIKNAKSQEINSFTTSSNVQSVDPLQLTSSEFSRNISEDIASCVNCERGNSRVDRVAQFMVNNFLYFIGVIIFVLLILLVKKKDKEESSFPPNLHWKHKTALVLIYPSILYCLYYSYFTICVDKTCPCWLVYIAMGVVLFLLLTERYIKHECSVHKLCLVDPNYVEGVFVDVDTIEPRIYGELDNKLRKLRPMDFSKKKKEIKSEKNRLKDRKSYCWTQYQVMNINQLMVEFHDIDDLIERARSYLEDLEDYTYKNNSDYDEELYEREKASIKDSIREINREKDREIYREKEKNDNEGHLDIKAKLRLDEVAEPLRAKLCMLIEHVADYATNWAEGTVILNSLRLFCVLSIPIVFFMGILPNICDDGNFNLFWYNWGLLGIVGSITGVLLDLRKSNTNEVGNTKGKLVLWNTILGAILGWLAGILAYSFIYSKLIVIKGLPPGEAGVEQFYLSIIIAISAGFSFEKIFDRIRNASNELGN